MTAATRDVIVTTMLLAMTVASLGAASPAEKPAAPSTAPSASDIAIAVTTTATAPAEISLPSFGLSVPLPQGYARDMDTEKSAVMIVPAGSVGRPQVRAIMVNVMPRQQPTFERAVEEALKTSGGLKVARKDAMWGDLKATELVPAPPAAAAAPPGKIARVGAPNPSDGAAGAFGPSATAKPAGVRTLRSLMLERDGYLFLLGLVGTGENVDDLRAFETVAAGTRWAKIERASASIAAREPPLTLPSGGITLSIPDPFRPEPGKAKNSAVFVARDLPTRVVASRLTITAMPRPAAGAPPRTLGDLKVEVDRTLAPQWRLKEPLKWGNSVGVVQATLSQPVRTSDGWMQAMLAVAPDGRATVFSLHSRGALEDSGRLDQVLRIIRLSIVPAK